MPDGCVTGPDTRHCAQCWRWKPVANFMGARGGIVTWCKDCRSKYRGGYSERVSAPRRGLPVVGAEPRLIWAVRSGNAKLGAIPSTIVSGETCPPSCGFFGRGCFAEFGILGYHWRRAHTEGVTWSDFIGRVRALPPGQLWRYATAGDLPGEGDDLDVRRLEELVRANAGRRGFTFTHKPLDRPAERSAVRRANAAGFRINLSADTLADADSKAALRCGPIAVVLPNGASGDIRTPKGLRVVVCPAERSGGITCEKCQLCSRERRGVVGFLAHGNMRLTVSKIAGGST